MDQSASNFDREGIMQTLSDDPIVLVWRDVSARMRRGEEYVDLQNLGLGVQRASCSMAPTGGELARKTVSAATWDKLLTYLAPRQPAPDRRDADVA